MARKKTVTTMSSDELFKLAEQRKKEEMAKEMEAAQEKINNLRAKRREIVAKHKKQLATIDNQIKKLGGKAPATTKKGRGSVTSSILAIIGSAGEVSTADLKKALAKKGVNAGNLAQTLAYLKRQGRIISPSRAVYKLA